MSWQPWDDLKPITKDIEKGNWGYWRDEVLYKYVDTSAV